ncbi:MAG: NAD-dependent epimerase/dehydratase family protein, partial [Candidatus Roizmanbacteria bacterium]|nr:NAD-dependent epimerase/dehydratase family protein [Candidatus Roizmanbacteria bacterium]
MSFLTNKKILLTGGAGFVGQYVYKALKEKRKSKKIFVPRSKEFDLREMKNCLQLTKNIDIVIHLAGNVGGIGYNRENPGSLFYDNITMGVNLIEAS